MVGLINSTKKAFIFPGQGSQYVGMGRDLFDKYGTAKKLFQTACEVLGFDIKKVIFEGPEEELKRTSNTQPAVYLINAVLFEVLKETKGLTPDFTAGHSLGEYSALYAAGVFDFQTGMSLVKYRGECIEEASTKNPGSMAALVGAVKEDVFRLCADSSKFGVIEPVNFNSQDQIVVAGTKEAVLYAVTNARSYGIKKAVELKVSGPFHSSLMNEAYTKFKPALDKAIFKNPVVPVITNYSAKNRCDAAIIKEDAALQIKSPVLWEASIVQMKANGVELYYEIGPGKVLAGLNRRVVPESTTINLDSSLKIEELC